MIRLVWFVLIAFLLPCLLYAATPTANVTLTVVPSAGGPIAPAPVAAAFTGPSGQPPVLLYNFTPGNGNYTSLSSPGFFGLASPGWFGCNNVDSTQREVWAIPSIRFGSGFDQVASCPGSYILANDVNGIRSMRLHYNPAEYDTNNEQAATWISPANPTGWPQPTPITPVIRLFPPNIYVEVRFSMNPTTGSKIPACIPPPSGTKGACDVAGMAMYLVNPATNNYATGIETDPILTQENGTATWGFWNQNNEGFCSPHCGDRGSVSVNLAVPTTYAMMITSNGPGAGQDIYSCAYLNGVRVSGLSCGTLFPTTSTSQGSQFNWRTSWNWQCGALTVSMDCDIEFIRVWGRWDCPPSGSQCFGPLVTN